MLGKYIPELFKVCKDPFTTPFFPFVSHPSDTFKMSGMEATGKKIRELRERLALANEEVEAVKRELDREVLAFKRQKEEVTREMEEADARAKRLKKSLDEVKNVLEPGPYDPPPPGG